MNRFFEWLKYWYWDIWFTNEKHVDKAIYLSEEQIAFNMRLENLRSEEE